MKNILTTTGLALMLTLGFSSCGKKAEDVRPKPPENFVGGTETKLVEENHLELQDAINSGNVQKIKVLLQDKNQVDFNKVLADGETLMTSAVLIDNVEIVDLLVENTANLTSKNKNLETPLMVASRLGKFEMVKHLINLGAKTDDKDKSGNTALHLAILNSNSDIALYLIKHNTNYDITNNDDQTPLKLAEMLGLGPVIDLLRSMTQMHVGLPDMATVKNIIVHGDVAGLNQLLKKNPTVVQEYEKLNMIVLAIQSQPHDSALGMTYVLMKYGASLQGVARYDETPLVEATKRGYLDFVDLMMAKKVNPNVVDGEGVSSLSWAIRINSKPIVKSLIKKSANTRYAYYMPGKRKVVVTACGEAKVVRAKLASDEASTDEDKKTNEEILELLSCSRRWPI